MAHTTPATGPRDDSCAQHVRDTYNVPLAEVGRHVTVDWYGARQMPGIITDIPDNPLRVRLTGTRSSVVLHPTSPHLTYLTKVIQVPELPMGAFTPTPEADQEGTWEGIGITSLDDCSTLAITGDKHQAMAALNAYHRELCEWPNLAGDDKPNATEADLLKLLEVRQVVFEWQEEGDEYPWLIRPATAELLAEHPEYAAYVTPVVWLEG